jgi:coatomer protein complex subunit epsilon
LKAFPQTINNQKKQNKTHKTMDPFSPDGELVNIHTAFIQGQHQLVLSDFNPSGFSESNRLAVQVLQHRAQIELGQASQVLSTVSAAKASSSPDLAAVRVYATFASKGAPQDDASVAEAEELAEQQGDNLTVQLLCGTVLARAGKQDLALQLLAKHQGSLDAVALIVQIHLSQNRTDLAVKEARGARSFAQDALLVNLAESWVGIRQVC